MPEFEVPSPNQRTPMQLTLDNKMKLKRIELRVLELTGQSISRAFTVHHMIATADPETVARSLAKEIRP